MSIIEWISTFDIARSHESLSQSVNPEVYFRLYILSGRWRTRVFVTRPARREMWKHIPAMFFRLCFLVIGNVRSSRFRVFIRYQKFVKTSVVSRSFGFIKITFFTIVICRLADFRLESFVGNCNSLLNPTLLLVYVIWIFEIFESVTSKSLIVIRYTVRFYPF